MLLLLKNDAIKIKVKNGSIFSETVSYLGQKTAPGHPQVAQKTIKAINIPRQSTTLSKMWFVSGLCNVYCQSVPISRDLP